MSKILDAIEARDVQALVSLLEQTGALAADEAEELRACLTFRRGDKDDTRRDLKRKAMAKLRYKQLRRDKIPVPDAIEQVANEFGFHIETVSYFAFEGKDHRVNALARRIEAGGGFPINR